METLSGRTLKTCAICGQAITLNAHGFPTESTMKDPWGQGEVHMRCEREERAGKRAA